MSNLGEAIRRARLARNMTQEELASKLQTTKSAISKYELGKREPSLALITKIALALSVRTEDIMGLETFDSPEDYHREWERRTRQSEGQQVTVTHYGNGKAQVIDHQKESLISTYDKLDAEDQYQLVKHGELLLNQPKYRDDEPPQEE